MKLLALALTLIFITLSPALSPALAEDEVLQIDIVKAPRRLPIAVMELTGPYGKVVAEIIAADLARSGLFETLPASAMREKPEQAFDKRNWTGTGVEAVVKGTVEAGAELRVTVTLNDAVEGKTVLEKQYRSDRTLIRPLSHTVASDIYRKITGAESAFRSKILYVNTGSTNHRIEVADWDGERAFAIGVPAPVILAPRWSPDGKSMMYTAQRGRSWGIYRANLSDMREELLVSTGRTDIAGDFFPDGSRIALSTSADGSPDISLYTFGSKALERITRNPGIEVSPSVSPGGRTIAFVSDRGGSPQIYTMDAMGYNIERLTHEGSYNTSPTWSPKGDVIYYSGLTEGLNQIYSIRPDGTDRKRLTSEGNCEEPSVSYDGRYIAFTSDRDGERAIYVMRATGDDQRRISRIGVLARSPRWSPK